MKPKKIKRTEKKLVRKWFLIALIWAIALSFWIQSWENQKSRAAGEPASDLQITQTVNKTATSAGDMLTYTITYKNQWPNNINNVSITTQLWNQMVFASATTPISQQWNNIIRNIGTLAVNGTGSYKIYANINQWSNNGTVTTFSTINGLVTDTNMNNNTASSQTYVNNSTNCIDQSISTTGLQINFTYSSPTQDVFIQSINFNNTSFPGLILPIQAVQLIPLPNSLNGVWEISTDHWDAATYTYPAQEDPSMSELVEMLGNNNINNIIDFEWIRNASIDIKFDSTIIDNSTSTDGYSELLIFERGMNSDIIVQAVNNLWGTPIGNPLLLKRVDQKAVWVQIDTTEIWSPQNVWYRRLDLTDLNVPATQIIRLTSLTWHNWPDIKIMGIKTTKCATFETDLELHQTVDTAVTVAGDTITYTINYINNGPTIAYGSRVETELPNDISLVSSSLTGSISWNKVIIPVWNLNIWSGWIIIVTGLISNTVVSWDILTTISTIFSDTPETNTTNNTDSSITRIRDWEKLKLVAICSDNPSVYKVWKIINENNVPVSYTAQIWSGSYNTLGIIQSSSESYIQTPTQSGNNTLSLFVNNVLQDTKTTTNVSCGNQIADLAILQSVDKIATHAWTYLFLTFDYSNNGPSNVNSVYIDVNLWPNLQFIESSLNWNFLSGNTRRFDIGNMNVFDNGAFYITGFIMSGLTINDTVFVQSHIDWAADEPNTGNNFDDTLTIIVKTGVVYSTTNDSFSSGTTVLPELSWEIQDFEISWEVKIDLTKENIFNIIPKVIGRWCHYTDEPYYDFDFVDMNGHRSYNFVKLLRLNCIVKGRYKNYKWFEPGQPITRAETIKIFTKLWGIKNELFIKGEKYKYIGDNPISDVPSNHRAANYIDYAFQAGLLDWLYEIKDGKRYIYPDKFITREEAVIMMMQAFSLINDYPLNKIQTQSSFSDIKGSKGENYIRHAEKLKMIEGNTANGKKIFRPSAPINRAELSKIVAQPFKNVLTLYRIVVDKKR